MAGGGGGGGRAVTGAEGDVRCGGREGEAGYLRLKYGMMLVKYVNAEALAVFRAGKLILSPVPSIFAHALFLNLRRWSVVIIISVPLMRLT